MECIAKLHFNNIDSFAKEYSTWLEQMFSNFQEITSKSTTLQEGRAEQVYHVKKLDGVARFIPLL
jgi:predicted metal-dependent hydrolase